MHRVELKAKKHNISNFPCKIVPNAPCGVERLAKKEKEAHHDGVPNAPCGVESASWTKLTM